MKRVKVRIFAILYDDVRSFYKFLSHGTLWETEVTDAERRILKEAKKILIVFNDKDGKRFTIANFLEKENAACLFEAADGVIENLAHGSHQVDYKEDFTIVPFQDKEMAKYSALRDKINANERNNLSTKLKNILNLDDVENKEILKALLEMNSKMDEILSILRPSFVVDGGFTVRCANISGSGFTFFSPVKIVSDKIFVRATISDGSSRFTFAVICDFKIIMENEDGSGLYSASFLNIDSDIEDNIVRFVFSIERSSLKELK